MLDGSLMKGLKDHADKHYNTSVKRPAPLGLGPTTGGLPVKMDRFANYNPTLPLRSEQSSPLSPFNSHNKNRSSSLTPESGYGSSSGSRSRGAMFGSTPGAPSFGRTNSQSSSSSFGHSSSSSGNLTSRRDEKQHQDMLADLRSFEKKEKQEKNNKSGLFKKRSYSTSF